MKPEEMVGRSITEARMSGEKLYFKFSDGKEAWFRVSGDCCSSSYFHDFIGVANLYCGPILEVKELDLDDDASTLENGEVKVYGYALTTEHPIFGPVTAVVSFRNYSNGYYGGWMEEFETWDDPRELLLLKVDVLGD